VGWSLLREEGRARLFMTTWEGVVLVKARFSEKLGDAL
jgi:hypothetical protein